VFSQVSNYTYSRVTECTHRLVFQSSTLLRIVKRKPIQKLLAVSIDSIYSVLLSGNISWKYLCLYCLSGWVFHIWLGFYVSFCFEVFTNLLRSSFVRTHNLSSYSYVYMWLVGWLPSWKQRLLKTSKPTIERMNSFLSFIMNEEITRYSTNNFSRLEQKYESRSWCSR
jgi:hypothetical protein